MCYISKPRKSRDSRDSGFSNPQIPGLETLLIPLLITISNEFSVYWVLRLISGVDYVYKWKTKF